MVTVEEKNYCKYGHYEEDNPYWPDCLNEETVARCDLCDEKQGDEGGFSGDWNPKTGCHISCEEHEARLVEFERTGQW